MFNMELRLKVSEDLNIKLKHYKIEQNLKNLNEVIVSILDDFFKKKEKEVN